MPPSVVFPASDSDVIAELDCADDETVRLLAGGTALALLTRYGFLQPNRLVSLKNLRRSLGHISMSRPGVLRLGAMATLAEIAHSAAVADAATAITRAASQVGNVRIRNVACLGGHLAHADPHMDLPPVLLALDAQAEIRGPDGIRWCTISDLISGYYETTLGQQELITAVEVPVGRQAVYSRYCSAAADDWPSVAVAAAIQAHDGRVAEPRLAIGAVAAPPRRISLAETRLDGVQLDDRARVREACREAAEAAADSVHPAADLHGSASYKREMVRVQVRRTLVNLLAGHGRDGRR
jgi:aerobic carbon-monoxide dehydrogenase medium subunit